MLRLMLRLMLQLMLRLMLRLTLRLTLRLKLRLPPRGAYLHRRCALRPGPIGNRLGSLKGWYSTLQGSRQAGTPDEQVSCKH